MDVKDAVKAAKGYVTYLLADEGMSNLGLEEVYFDEKSKTWQVTLGFSRPWNSSRGSLTSIVGETVARRAYRTVAVRDEDGEVLSIKKRDLVE